jgi:Flp pilus assembly pilin Flp
VGLRRVAEAHHQLTLSSEPMNPAASTTTLIVARAENGQTMAEYGVVLALITLGVVGALTVLDGAIVGMFGRIAGFLGG